MGTWKERQIDDDLKYKVWGEKSIQTTEADPYCKGCKLLSNLFKDCRMPYEPGSDKCKEVKTEQKKIKK
jgi:hypothetical protein